MTDHKICFIDFEASSLNRKLSFPTEIGWAFVDGTHDSRLIYPVQEWTEGETPSLETEWSGWVKKGELVTGITRSNLLNDGRTVNEVIEDFELATAGYEIYADNPYLDGFWMKRLYEAAGSFRAPEVLDFNHLISPFVRGLVGQTQYILTEYKAAEIAPHTHRAGKDALHLATLYRLLLEENYTATFAKCFDVSGTHMDEGTKQSGNS